jgi:hypothetical protein
MQHEQHIIEMLRELAKAIQGLAYNNQGKCSACVNNALRIAEQVLGQDPHQNGSIGNGNMRTTWKPNPRNIPPKGKFEKHPEQPMDYDDSWASLDDRTGK